MRIYFVYVNAQRRKGVVTTDGPTGQRTMSDVTLLWLTCLGARFAVRSPRCCDRIARLGMRIRCRLIDGEQIAKDGVATMVNVCDEAWR
jgi:hypothetical protein